MVDSSHSRQESRIELIPAFKLLIFLVALSGSYTAEAQVTAFVRCPLSRLKVSIFCTNEERSLFSDYLFWDEIDASSSPESLGSGRQIFSALRTTSEKSWLTSFWKEIFEAIQDGESMKLIDFKNICKSPGDGFKFQWGHTLWWLA